MTSRLLESVETVARLTGDEAMRHYRAGVRVERKPDGTAVSEADRSSERVAREWIASRFPADGIVGEELGETNPGARRRWLIDPIDGTAAFVRKVPLWGSLIAVLEGDDVLAGAIYCPLLEEIVVAEAGAGCWWNGKHARVSEVDRIEQAVVLNACDCYGYLRVASGRAEVMTDPVVKPWDVAAPLVVVTEAGGVFTDWKGQVTAFGGNAIATNAALAQVARDQLRNRNG